MKWITRFSIKMILMSLLVFLMPTQAFAYAVPPLPEDNLIVNPFFRSTSAPSESGMDGWTPVLQDGVGWGLSQKESNPSPDIVISGKCGGARVYCGTGARWANQLSEKDVASYPDLDVYLYQVVATDPSHRRLKFFMYWVNHKIDVAEVNIFGSDTSSGPWQEVWKPFSLTQVENPSKDEAPGRNGNPWFDTGFLETVIAEGFPYYKLEIHARYAEADTAQGDVGIKITGVYLATESSDAPVDTIQQAVILDDTLTSSSNRKQANETSAENTDETGTPDSKKSRDQEVEETPEPEGTREIRRTQIIVQSLPSATATAQLIIKTHTPSLETQVNIPESSQGDSRRGITPVAVIGISSMGVIIILAAIYTIVHKKHL